MRDNNLAFVGVNELGTTVAADVMHRVVSIDVGQAYYVNLGRGAGGTIKAKIYGLMSSDSTSSMGTLLTTLDVTGGSAAYTFPVDAYEGFAVVYTADNGGKLKPQFKADPVAVTMSFSQEDNASVVVANKITNTAKSMLAYTIDGTQYPTGWTESSATY